ncbi:alpha/beta fold hydrolase [Plantibacter sp. YIM 135249]|uniref:alpha/beta fold hydrolase n=1 Tax=Plantibacter sp. YIM 135249 TaxID=3423918 RepID=UPI003D33D5BB
MNLTEPDGLPPTYVMTHDGVRLATYLHSAAGPTAEGRSTSEPAADGNAADALHDTAPLVVAVHGFASSAALNWDVAGWTRALTRAGYRLLTIDQRGHGASDKPHDAASYGVDTLMNDVIAVLDAYGFDVVHYLGYSLGARVGWRIGVKHPSRVHTLSLGGLPEGDPLRTFDLDAARAHAATSSEVHDALTASYVSMVEGVPGNDLEALIALVEGMRSGAQPSTEETPTVPALLVSGDQDAIAEGSRRLAAATPGAEFVSLPGRNHVNAVSSRGFKDAVLAFLAAH